MKKDLLCVNDLSEKEIMQILSFAAKLKNLRGTKSASQYHLKQKTIVMIFEKPSLRTRVTFEVAMNDLMGNAIYLSPENIQPGKRESIKDIALNLDRWTDGIVARTFFQTTLEELARYTKIPVINALSDLYHPCQALAFAQTVYEQKKKLKGLHVVFVGDGNNVCHSIMTLSSKLGIHFTLAYPAGYGPKPAILAAAHANCAKSKGSITLMHNAEEAVRNADVIYTDTWASMGQESEIAKREKIFRTYQVNRSLLEKAKPDCLVSHCLPAHRGKEITDEVLESSIAFDEAENRLHVQKAILLTLIGR